jgi:hypothetical protein
MFPIHGLERVSNWFRGVSEPFARPLSAQALRIILIIMPGAVLIRKGSGHACLPYGPLPVGSSRFCTANF